MCFVAIAALTASGTDLYVLSRGCLLIGLSLQDWALLGLRKPGMEADGDLRAAHGPSAFLPACYGAPRCILKCCFFQAVTYQPLFFVLVALQHYTKVFEAPLLRL